MVFNPLGSDTVYAATTVGVFRSSDGGRTWTERMAGMTEINFVVALAIDPTHPNIMYAGTTGGVYRTKNATESWEKITQGMVAFDAKMASMALGVNRIVVDPTQSDIVYAGTTQGLYKSLNQGDQWKKVGNDLKEVYISGIQLNPINTDILYLATSQGVQKSIDGGMTWMIKNSGIEATSIRSIGMSPQNQNILYAGTNGGGLYRTVDGGENWSRIPLTPAASL